MSECSKRVRYRVEHFRIKFISTGRHVIFGLLETDCEIINFCVLHAKWFMYIQYMSDSANFSGACNVRNYCGYLKNIVKVEKDCNVLGHRDDELLNVLERN